MKRCMWFALFALVTVTGCSPGPVTQGRAPQVDKPEARAGRYLAYQHALRLDVEEKNITALFDAGQAVCREAAAEEACTVLETRINTGREPSAFFKVRAKPGGIRKVIATLSQQAEVVDQSSTAEDLASPIEDAARKLAMLNDYRAKLEVLRGRANNDVDALIKVNRELAQVQSDLEAMTGKHAHLMERVETEILSVSMHTLHKQSFWRPVGRALSDFGGNLSQGLSWAVTGLAYLLPWAVVLILGVWVVRKLWRRRAR